MARAADLQILVVGAGPTGLTLACELFSHGVPCRVIDAADPSAVKGSRAIGVSARSLEVFDDFGAARPLVERGVRSKGAVFYSGRSATGRVTTDAVRHTRHPYMLTVPQPETERVLAERLRELGGTVERAVELRELTQEPGADVATAVLAHADGTTETVTASWVVGADGAHSTVRKQAGIAFDGGAAKDAFVIVDVHADAGPPPGEGHYFFHPDGMSLVAPLPDGAYRLAATVTDKGRFTDPEAAVSHVQELYRRRIGAHIRIRGLRDAGWGVASTTVRTRLAATLRAGRCLIAGDAAHLYGPVGGQGMNGGIQDAQNLAWKLALVSLGHADESLLDTYEAERLPAARVALAAADQQTKMSTLRPWPARKLRDLLLRMGTRTGKLEQRLIPSLTQLGGTFAQNSFFGSATGDVGGAGSRIPDTAVDGAAGADTLYDVLRREHFTVLVLGAGADDEAAVRRLNAELGNGTSLVPQLVVVHQESARKQPLKADAVDRGDGLHTALDVSTPSVYLVRPDQFIGVSCPLSGTGPLTDALAKIRGQGGPVEGSARQVGARGRQQ